MSDQAISHRTRRIILSGFFFFTGICFASWASRIPDIKIQLNLNDAQFGGMLLFLPLGIYLTYKAANDSALFDIGRYLEPIKKLFPKKQKAIV